LFLAVLTTCYFVGTSLRGEEVPVSTDPCAWSGLSYVECPGTPQMGYAEYGVRIAFSDGGSSAAFGAEDFAWMLHGAYLVAREDLRESCGRPKDVLWIVVRDPHGRIHTCGIVDSARKPATSKGFPVKGGPLAQGGMFNIDLRSHCHLEPAPGVYRVVALLLGHSSTQVSFTVGSQSPHTCPGDDLRARQSDLSRRVEHSVRVIAGALSLHELKQVISKRRRALVLCAWNAMKRAPDLSGRLTLSM
jgi:hypothetical protein